MYLLGDCKLVTQQAHHFSSILTKEKNKHWVSYHSRHGKLSPNYHVQHFLSSQLSVILCGHCSHWINIDEVTLEHSFSRQIMMVLR